MTTTNQNIINNIYSSFEKGRKAQIGEEREWGGKKYRKVEEGKWEEVKKERKLDKNKILEKVDKFSDNIKGIYKDIYKKDKERFLFEVAQQSNSSEGEKKGVIGTVGSEIVNLALQIYPNVKVGDKFYSIIGKK